MSWSGRCGSEGDVATKGLELADQIVGAAAAVDQSLVVVGAEVVEVGDHRR